LVPYWCLDAPDRIRFGGKGRIMAVKANEITWGHDLDAALADAKKENKAVLLDFSAAPM
jgi:TPP-dependent trihydroxycyclohexane-1,2-dione (THcHDO) dehydratase